MIESDDEKTQLYKVLVIGDYAVGKTSIIKRYCEGHFNPQYKLTIGVDFAIKRLTVGDDKDIVLQLWDVAGNERFGTMTALYYKYAIAGLVVFDLSRPATFEAVEHWRDDINSKVVLPNGDPIPLILIANKCDLPDADIDVDLDEYARENGFLACFKTSAQEDVGIDNGMSFLVENILSIADQNIPQRDTSAIVITSDKKQKPKRRNEESEPEQKGLLDDCCT
eukprot:TRINITY_DN3589_c0_g1_i1.p1 TRINITY_DN3589_c0_g1~~TRINITY_DN3589_c0_g1_i1.p1  ORF type:complete len:223 (+),score=49.45 TRINITY_DN3589_c0_g1_i1:42-710(+)